MLCVYPTTNLAKHSPRRAKYAPKSIRNFTVQTPSKSTLTNLLENMNYFSLEVIHHTYISRSRASTSAVGQQTHPNPSWVILPCFSRSVKGKVQW